MGRWTCSLSSSPSCLRFPSSLILPRMVHNYSYSKCIEEKSVHYLIMDILDQEGSVLFHNPDKKGWMVFWGKKKKKTTKND